MPIHEKAVEFELLIDELEDAIEDELHPFGGSEKARARVEAAKKAIRAYVYRLMGDD